MLPCPCGGDSRAGGPCPGADGRGAEPRLHSTTGRPSIAPERFAAGHAVDGVVLDPFGASVDGSDGLQPAVPLVCGPAAACLARAFFRSAKPAFFRTTSNLLPRT